MLPPLPWLLWSDVRRSQKTIPNVTPHKHRTQWTTRLLNYGRDAQVTWEPPCSDSRLTLVRNSECTSSVPRAHAQGALGNTLALYFTFACPTHRERLLPRTCELCTHPHIAQMSHVREHNRTLVLALLQGATRGGDNSSILVESENRIGCRCAPLGMHVVV